MPPEADFNVVLHTLKLDDKLTDPMVQGTVASLILKLLDALDTVQGDQLCHMRSVLMVLYAGMLRSHLIENGDLKDAEQLAKQSRRLGNEKKMADDAFLEEYAGLVKTCYKVLGQRRMEISTLCYDTTRDVTWVFTPTSISTYFRDQGRVENKAQKQARLQVLCIEEFKDYIAGLCKRDLAGPFLKQLQKALERMQNRITEGGKNIPVLNFFVASLVVFIMNFMETDISAAATRRMPIAPPAQGSSSGNGTVALDSILIEYFKHNRQTGQHEPITLEDYEKDIPLLFTQGWSKYRPGQSGSGLHSANDEAYALAFGEQFNELIVRYLTNHPSYADSVEYDVNETEKVLEEICGRKTSNSQETDVKEFSFSPFGENASLIDVWYQAKRETNLGAGVHKPLDTVIRGKIYKETTDPTAWNIDHIFGATANQIEQWAAHTLGAHKKAGNPQCGYYEVVAGSATLPCNTEEEARSVANAKDKKRKKDFIKAHLELEPVIGLSWNAAFVQA